MSQKKIDERKELKKKRASLNKKEKVIRTIEYIVLAIIAAGIIFWIGYSIFNTATKSEEGTTVAKTWDVTDYNEYRSNLTLVY